MWVFERLSRRARRMGVVGCGLLLLAGCGDPGETLALGVVGATALGGQAPTHEIQQIYYLGVFDPQDQLPPQVYRVRVHGQASFISVARFASGWVPANLIDSLSTGIKFEKTDGQIEITDGDDNTLATLKTGRRLMMFGPEGFREAPAGHRLVVVMGSNPEGFFSAIDESLGTVSAVLEEQRAAGLTAELFTALTLVKNEGDRLVELDKDLAADPVSAKQGGGQ